MLPTVMTSSGSQKPECWCPIVYPAVTIIEFNTENGCIYATQKSSFH